MALLIDNDVTRRVLETADAVDVLADAFTQLANDEATFQPRTDLVSPVTESGDDYDWDGDPEWYTWGSLLGAITDPPRLALRFKSDVLSWETVDDTVVESKYNVEPGTFMGFVLLFDSSSGELLGLLNDGELQHVRVGATAGVAADHLARDDAETVGMLGSGGMARTYLEAFAAVRDISRVTVYSPTTDHREAYATEMSERLGVDVEPVDSAEAAVTDVDIAAACTDTRNPVYFEEWLSPGTFVTNTVPTELSDGTLARADRVVTTDNRPFQRYVIGDEEDDRRYKQRHPEWFEQRDYETLGEVLTSEGAGRQSDEETIVYDNISAGIQFAAVGNLVYERASERDLGVEIPLSWFQQDIRN
jgi:ornithine cyclodeaminase/alanine dehydrogenase-like protein (mu-crystallin family)